MSDLYSTLGVSRNADAAAIKKAYRKASKRAHPDGGGSAEKFHKVNLALQVLTDPARRKIYDETGKIDEKPADNAQSELMGTVSALLDAVLQNLDQQGIAFEQTDLIQRMKQVAAGRQTEIHKHRSAMKVGIEKQRKLLKRFKRRDDGENIMEGLISGRLAYLEGQDSVAQRQLDAIKKAELFLADYKFESEKYEATQRVQFFTTASWT